MDELLTLQFLDKWDPAVTLAAAAAESGLELEPANPWLMLLGPALGAWIFGTFAWMAKPFVEGGPPGGMGVKFLALAALPLGVAIAGIGSNVLKDRTE